MPATGVYRSAANAGCGAGYGAGCRQPSAEWGQYVGDALRRKFHIRVVLIAAHPIGDDGRHQRLNRPQQRYRDGGRDQRSDHGVFENRQMEAGKTGRYPPKARPDGLDRQMKNVDDGGSRKQGHDVPGNQR